MRSFTCPKCGTLLFFENSRCLACGTEVAFDRTTAAMVCVPPALRCVNAVIAACNWATEAPDSLCACCKLTRTRPNDNDEAGLAAFARAQGAARRLLYQLDDLGLPVRGRDVDPDHGLAFDLLSSVAGPVTTGHEDGVITIDLAESDDGHREALRVSLEEPYRTVLGHFRHEIGHYYWTVLVQDRPALEVFRALFGDERADYGEALAQHYANSSSRDWEDIYVSSYAAAHPWEDWAETFAHYLHIRDTLQTAASYRVVVVGPELPAEPDPTAPLASVPLDRSRDFDAIIDAWLPLSYALNAMNRSMGKDDAYPFVLSPTVLEKLRLVHALITAEAADRVAA